MLGMLQKQDSRRRRRMVEARGRPPIQAKLRNHGDGSQNTYKPFKFFKIVLPAILQSNTLRVPETFVKECSPQFPRVSTLTTPGGLTWKALLRELEGRVYFTGRGWVDFMEHNHIQRGYFLEFEYEGDNHFMVYILDLSCGEIDYPTEPKQKHRMDLQVEEDEDEEEIHNSEDTIMLESKSSSPCFTVTVRKYNISSNAYLHIPRSFTNEYMKGKLYKFVELQVGDGREWLVKCYYVDGDTRLAGSGWKKFQQETHWENGQIYTFTLMNSKRNIPVFKVLKKKGPLREHKS